MKRYTCPACGHKTLEQYPGSDDICPVCFWHDDLSSLDCMYKNIGPNHVSLELAQVNYEKCGAIEARLKKYTREPKENEPKDPTWRKVNRNIDEEVNFRADDPLDRIYYWLRKQ